MKTNFADNNRRQNRNQSNNKRKTIRPVVLEKRVQNKPSNVFRIEGTLAIICSHTRYVRMAS